MTTIDTAGGGYSYIPGVFQYSSGVEDRLDAGGGGHSVFAKAPATATSAWPATTAATSCS